MLQMKTKTTLIILEIPSAFNGVIPTVSTVIRKDNGKFPSKFISAGSVEHTITSLCSDVCNVHRDFLDLKLKDLVKDGPETVEAIYCASVPKGVLSVKNCYKSYPLEDIFLEDKYGFCIRQFPRLTGG